MTYEETHEQYVLTYIYKQVSRIEKRQSSEVLVFKVRK